MFAVRVVTALSLVTVAGCLPVKGGDDDGPRRHGERDGHGEEDDGGDGSDNRAPSVRSVAVSPRAPFVDGTATCSAEVGDPDGDEVSVSYRWENATRGTSLGGGATIALDPSDISPGETLRCTATATDPRGAEDADDADVEPGCGFADEDALRDVDVEVDIVFRPWMTDDVEPGWGGEPWDWDGDVPDWILDVSNGLEEILGFASSVYPDPQLVSAAEVAGYVSEILEVVDEYGPGLMAATVPPDPQIYPYVFDGEELYAVVDGDEWRSWDDTYELTFRLPGLDLSGIDGLAVDIEDVDAAFNDNMGDLLDQETSPLALASSLFLDGGYCTSVYYNPEDTARSSEVAYIPGSILWMSITVE